jgi:hypothetical protein
MTDSDLARAAMACRSAAHLAEQDAANQSNPSIKEQFLTEARKYRELAEQFEKMRAV